MKKIISVLLAICILITVASIGMVASFAAGGTQITGTEVLWSYDSDTRVLSFSGKGAIPDYTYHDYVVTFDVTYPWRNLPYTSVTFGEEISGIGNNAFCYSEALKEVTIPETITVLGEGVFLNCEKLETVVINSDNVNLKKNTFAGCDKLSSVTFAKKVSEIGERAFYNCKLLTEFAVPQGVTSIGKEAFKNCTGLKTLSVAETVKTIGEYAFCDCEALEAITFAEGLETIGRNAFDNCRVLKTVKIPDSVKSISTAAFSGCRALTSVTIGANVESVGEKAFNICTALKSVEIGHSVKTIGKMAFGYGVLSAKIDGFTIIGYNETAAQKYATDNGFAFVSLGNYYDGDCGENAKWSFDSEKGVLSITGTGKMADFEEDKLPAYSRFAAQIKEISIDTKITGIGNYAFYNMTPDNTVVPKEVVEIGLNALGNEKDGALDKELTIKGYAGSAAEEYAALFGMKFVDITPIPTQGKCGENAEWSYDADKKTLTISGKGAVDGCTVEAPHEFAKHKFEITEVIVEDGITALGDNALLLDTPVNKITFGKDIADLGENSFGYCIEENGEGKPEAIACTDLTAYGYNATPVKQRAEAENFKYVSIDKVEFDGLKLDASVKAVVDDEKHIIYLYETALTSTALGEKITKVEGIDYKLSEGAIGTGSTVTAVNGIEETVYTVIIPGDVSEDGAVNSIDALGILNHSVEAVLLTGNAAMAGDVDNSKSINSADALIVLQISVAQIELASLKK